MSQPPKAVRGTFYKRQMMAALDCIALYQRRHQQSPTLTQVAEMMAVSVPTACARLREAREAGFITWTPYVPRSYQFVKVG